MKRPLIYITAGYIIGIIWGLYLKLSIAPVFFILIIAFFLLVKIKLINLDKLKKYKFSIISFIIFAIISNIQIQYLENKFDNLYNDLENVEIIGVIISEKSDTNYKASYTVKVESINKDKKYSGTNLIIYTSKEQNIDYGSMIKFSGTYEKAQSATNYKAFDYQEYLKTKNVYGIINVEEEVNIIKKDALNPILIFANNVKIKIKSNLKAILGEDSALIMGILLRRYFRNTRRDYRKF